MEISRLEDIFEPDTQKQAVEYLDRITDGAFTRETLRTKEKFAGKRGKREPENYKTYFQKFETFWKEYGNRVIEKLEEVIRDETENEEAITRREKLDSFPEDYSKMNNKSIPA